MVEKKDNKENTFVDHVVSVRRVTKVTKGGKRFSFSAFVVSGDKQGKIGIAIGKSKEVSLAIAKATNRARKNLITVSFVEQRFLMKRWVNMEHAK